MTEELPGMPPKARISILSEKYAEQTDDINKRRAIRRETKKEIIAALRELKKGELSINQNGYRYTFRIVPGDANLQVAVSPLKTKDD